MANVAAELRSARAAFDNGNIEKVASHVEQVDDGLDADCNKMVSNIKRQAARNHERRDRLVVEKELDRIERRVERET